MYRIFYFFLKKTHSSTLPPHIQKGEMSEFQSEKSEMWPNRKTSNKEAMAQVLLKGSTSTKLRVTVHGVILLRTVKMQLTEFMYLYLLIAVAYEKAKL